MLKINNKKTLILYIIIPLLILSFLIVHEEKIDNEQPIENIINQVNSNSCKYSNQSIIKAFKNRAIEFELVNTSISYIPNIKNSQCLLNTEKIQKDIYGRYKIYSTTSTRLINLIEVINICFLFYLLKVNYFKRESIIFFILINQLTVFFLFNYLQNQNYFSITFFLKTLFLFFLFDAYFENKKTSNNKTFIYIFTLFAIGNNLIQTKIDDRIEIYYFNYAFKADSNLSSIIGPNHTQVFANFVKGFHFIFGDYYKFFLELIITLWISYLIYLFSRMFELSNLMTLLFGSLVLYETNIIGGEGLFGSVLPKNFSYLCIFTSCYFLYSKKINYSLIFYSMSFYFHFALSTLFLPIYIYIYIASEKYTRLLKDSLMGVILTLPMSIYLFIINYSSRELDQDYAILNQKFIYTISNHLYPFIFENGQFKEINQIHFREGFLVLSLYILVLIFLKLFVIKSKDFLLDLTIFNSIVFIFYIAIIFFFPFSDFVLLHPFRFVTFFAISIFLFVILKAKLINNNYKILINFIALLIISNNVIQSLNLYEDSKVYKNYFNEYNNVEKTITSPPELEAYLSNKDVSLFLTPAFNTQSIFNDVEYVLNVPTYVSYFHIPLNINSLNTWEYRLKNLEEFYKGDCERFDELLPIHFIDYNRNNECGDLIKSFKGYYLYIRR